MKVDRWYGLYVDVPPDNILCTLRGEPKICLAQIRDLRSTLPATERANAKVVGANNPEELPLSAPIWAIERQAMDLASPLWTTAA